MGLLEQLRGIAESLEIHSSDSFTLLGQRRTTRSPESEHNSDSILTARAQQAFAEVLYGRLHCRSGDSVAVSSRTTTERREFAARLAAMNCGTGPWHGDWRVERVDRDGRVVVSLDGLKLWASRSDFRTSDGGITSGSVGELRMPAEYRNLYPGYYSALGDADTGRITKTVRIYWHLLPAGAHRFVDLVTAEFNRAAIPFQLKILDDPAAYDRTDAAVLYLPRERLPDASPLLAQLYQGIQSHCREPVSHFCLRLAPGVACAEDPPDPGTSFGLHRSELIAACFSNPEVAGKSTAERVAIVTGRLTALGFGPARFHLNPGSPDIALCLT